MATYEPGAMWPAYLGEDAAIDNKLTNRRSRARILRFGAEHPDAHAF